MENFIRLLLLGIAITYVIFNADVGIQAQNDCKEFTDEEIKQNIHKYVNIVFGSKTPTLQEYFNFEGENKEADEFTFEIEECVRRGWIPPVESPECIHFTKERAENANKVHSYYYNFLRTLIKKEDRNLVIHKINHLPQKQENELKTVLVDASLGETYLQFYHAGDTCGVPLGLVMLTKIGDKPISEILKYRKYKKEAKEGGHPLKGTLLREKAILIGKFNFNFSSLFLTINFMHNT